MLLGAMTSNMRVLSIFFSLLFLTLLVSPSNAQDAVREQIEISDSGEAYLESLRFRRINPEVSYFDPSAPAPELKTDSQPDSSQYENEEERNAASRTSTSSRWLVGIISAAIIIAIVFLFVRFGGSMSVSLKSEATNAERSRSIAQPHAPDWATRTGTFDEILRLRDRRKALIELMRKALASTVSANGILMQRSWTARDALGHLPQSQAHLDRLRDLVFATERVYFGGKDISEEDFQIHADTCRLLLDGADQ